jgi:hypothetical protein
LQESEVSPPYEAQSEGENENERLLLFSEGIIAFTITLATISIRLPSDKPVAELPTLLTVLYQNLITYLIGFVIVGSYWYEHWRFFRYIKHSTTTLVVWNLLFLASLVFLPFLSHFYGGNFYLSGDRESLNFFSWNHNFPLLYIPPGNGYTVVARLEVCKPQASTDRRKPYTVCDKEYDPETLSRAAGYHCLSHSLCGIQCQYCYQFSACNSVSGNLGGFVSLPTQKRPCFKTN